MPCDSEVTLGLAMANVDPARLATALKAAGYTVTTPEPGVVAFYGNGVRSGHWKAGKLDLVTSRMGGSEAPAAAANAVRRAYSAEVVREAARTFGAQVVPDAQNKNEMTLRLRQGRG